MALLRGSPLLTIHKGTRPEDADDMKERGERKKNHSTYFEYVFLLCDVHKTHF